LSKKCPNALVTIANTLKIPGDMENKMALVWGAVCTDCQILAVENCPHCSRDLCEKHSAQHECDRLKARNYEVAG